MAKTRDRLSGWITLSGRVVKPLTPPGRELFARGSREAAEAVRAAGASHVPRRVLSDPPGWHRQDRRSRQLQPADPHPRPVRVRRLYHLLTVGYPPTFTLLAAGRAVPDALVQARLWTDPGPDFVQPGQTAALVPGEILRMRPAVVPGARRV
jgi:hypothetical protein